MHQTCHKSDISISTNFSSGVWNPCSIIRNGFVAISSAKDSLYFEGSIDINMRFWNTGCITSTEYILYAGLAAAMNIHRCVLAGYWIVVGKVTSAIYTLNFIATTVFSTDVLCTYQGRGFPDSNRYVPLRCTIDIVTTEYASLRIDDSRGRSCYFFILCVPGFLIICMFF